MRILRDWKSACDCTLNVCFLELFYTEGQHNFLPSARLALLHTLDRYGNLAQNILVGY